MGTKHGKSLEKLLWRSASMTKRETRRFFITFDESSLITRFLVKVDYKIFGQIVLNRAGSKNATWNRAVLKRTIWNRASSNRAIWKNTILNKTNLKNRFEENRFKTSNLEKRNLQENNFEERNFEDMSL